MGLGSGADTGGVFGLLVAAFTLGAFLSANVRLFVPVVEERRDDCCELIDSLVVRVEWFVSLQVSLFVGLLILAGLCAFRCSALCRKTPVQAAAVPSEASSASSEPEPPVERVATSTASFLSPEDLDAYRPVRKIK
jgi:hypothetical protein